MQAQKQTQKQTEKQAGRRTDGRRARELLSRTDNAFGTKKASHQNIREHMMIARGSTSVKQYHTEAHHETGFTTF